MHSRTRIGGAKRRYGKSQEMPRHPFDWSANMMNKLYTHSELKIFLLLTPISYRTLRNFRRCLDGLERLEKRRDERGIFANRFGFRRKSGRNPRESGGSRTYRHTSLLYAAADVRRHVCYSHPRKQPIRSGHSNPRPWHKTRKTKQKSLGLTINVRTRIRFACNPSVKITDYRQNTNGITFK